MLDLLDYRRRVQDMYLPVRANGGNPSIWLAWQSQRNHLFQTHPQSPLDDQQKATFSRCGILSIIRLFAWSRR